MKNKNYILGYTYAFLSALGFGIMGVIGITVYNSGLSIFDLLSWRFGIASIILTIISLKKGLFKKVMVKDFFACFLMGIVGYTGLTLLFFNSIKFIDVGLTTVLLYTYPIFVLIISKVVDRQYTSFYQIVLIILSFIGIILAINLNSSVINKSGVLLGIGSGIWYAVYLKIGEKIVKDVNPLLMTTFVSMGTFIFYFTGALYRGGIRVPSGLNIWISVIMLALFSTVLAIVLLFGAMEKIGALKTSLISNIEPIVAIVSGFLFLSEKITQLQFLGILIILITITIIVYSNESTKINNI